MNPNPSNSPLTAELVREALRNVYDMELQINIVDLGLVYDVNVSPEGAVKIKMTLTSPGCPYGAELLTMAKESARSLNGVTSVDLDLVWDPPWSTEKMSEATRLELGMDL